MLLKSRLRVGDTLWLTKPIGTGVLTTAHKNGTLEAADLASAIASMVTLNRAAAQAAVDAELHAATDVTGFGLAGHAHEMAEQSSVGVRIRASLVPLLPGARRHAATGISFGGLERNRAYFDDGTKVRFEGVDDVLRTLILDPQTSGGLLVGVPTAHAEAWKRAYSTRSADAVQIGEVIAGSGVNVFP
jgi:selenide,water dikinase